MQTKMYFENNKSFSLRRKSRKIHQCFGNNANELVHEKNNRFSFRKLTKSIAINELDLLNWFDPILFSKNMLTFFFFNKTRPWKEEELSDYIFL